MTIVVSIIIPAHNEEVFLAQAIESALFQKTTFEFEIIFVDDGSTDGTRQIAERYAKISDKLRVIHHPKPLGKGASVREAYNSARGKYIHVLDGDDMFTNWDKIQYQAEELDRNESIFAVAHNTLCCNEDGTVYTTPGVEKDQIFSYMDCCELNFYCHTSSHMFRKIDTGLPEYFERNPMRGDTALAYFHAFHWKKSVLVLAKVMSTYRIHNNGIWTSLDAEDRTKLNIEIWKDLQNYVVRDKKSDEYLLLQNRINKFSARMERSNRNTSAEPHEFFNMNDVVEQCESQASSVFQKETKEKAFLGMHSLPLIDTMLDTVGHVLLAEQKPSFLDQEFTSNTVVFLVSGFVPRGGGVFREIAEIKNHLLKCGFEILIVSTGKIETDNSVIETHFNDERIRYFLTDSTQNHVTKIRDIQSTIHREKPTRVYPFLTHHDAVGVAALQRGLAGEIIFDFVYDHGLSFGIHLGGIDKIVVKNNSQASALAPTVRAERLALLPPFLTDQVKSETYHPLKNEQITTASAAAREYKVEAGYKYSYFDVVLRILSESDAQHIHFGPLSQKALRKFRKRLHRAGVPENRFQHIAWVEDFGNSLLEKGVDLFLSPFPVCSARIAIEVMACGIPLLNHQAAHPTLPEAGDFVDPDQLQWREPDDVVRIVSDLSAASLSRCSKSARAYFEKNNDADVCLEKFVLGNFETPTIHHDPEFRMQDLSSFDFFSGEVWRVFGSAAGRKSKRDRYWHRGPIRRMVRAKFKGLQNHLANARH